MDQRTLTRHEVAWLPKQSPSRMLGGDGWPHVGYGAEWLEGTAGVVGPSSELSLDNKIKSITEQRGTQSQKQRKITILFLELRDNRK